MRRAWGARYHPPVYALSTAPPAGATAYLVIDSGASAGVSGTNYYATITAASGMVPWSAFESKPYQLDASVGLGTTAPSSASHVQFQVSAGTASIMWQTCVTSLKFM